MSYRWLSSIRSYLTPKRLGFIEPSEQDCLLVSFPRSGNTWVRVILAELLYGTSGVSLQELQFYIPDIHVPMDPHKIVKSDFHIIKSHFPLQRSPKTLVCKQVIYLIRDPRDVVLSHFRYHEKLRQYQYGFDHFYFDWINGRIWPGSWQEHVNSWTGEGSEIPEFKFLIVRYEDLKRDSVNQATRLATFLDLNVSPDDIQHAVESASITNMRNKENAGMRDLETAKGFKFIGTATSGTWHEKLTDEQLELLSKHAGIAMKQHGYT